MFGISTENAITLAAALAAFIAAVIAAGVSMYTTRTRRYLLERIWDRKVAAYADIVSALSDLTYPETPECHRCCRHRPRQLNFPLV